MEALANFADYLWILTKIVFLSIILIVTVFNILAIFVGTIFGRKQVENKEE